MADLRAKARAAVAAVRTDGLSGKQATTPGFWEDPEASRQALKEALLSLTDGPYAASVGVFRKSNFGKSASSRPGSTRTRCARMQHGLASNAVNMGPGILTVEGKAGP